MKIKLNGTSQLLITAIIFGSFGLFAYVLSERLFVIETLFYVKIIEFIFFISFCLVKKYSFRIPLKKLFLLTLFGAVNSLPILFFNLAISVEKIGIVLLVQNTGTIISSILVSRFVLKEKIDIVAVGLMIIALLGISTVYLPLEVTRILGLVFACFTGLSNTLTNLFRRKLGKQINNLILGFYSSVISLFIYGSQLFISHKDITISQNLDLLPMLLLYGALSALTTFLLISGFKKVHFTMGNIILTLEIVFGIFFGAIFLRQFLGSNQLTGSLIILISVFLVRILQLEKNEE
jgi:drug/metabolite transporter (DMT)-like permease